MPDEEALLRQIAERSADMAGRHPRTVAVGPGDDCAILRAGDPAHPLLLALSVDQLIEGRHFTPDTPPDLIARKAIARAVSDLAAVAARPAWSLAAGVLPSEDPRASELCDRLAHWGEHFGVPVVGGDLATIPRTPNTSPAPMVLSITVAGEIDPAAGERPILRAGALPGDALYVTDRIGNSLHSRRHLSFTPRTVEALELRRSLGDRLHAMIDVSDGVGRDAARIARASTLAVEINAHQLPLHPDASGRAPNAEDDAQRAVADGEDYELLFAATGDVPTHVANTPITRIGRFFPGEPGACDLLLADGRRLDVRAAGWSHR
ncbi:MAG: thiamine-monophosphate kinase [Phycisphaeraceae bacterium]|nr:thiamine-monophosphate kinase [Phycisphaeraceae bacterium]